MPEASSFVVLSEVGLGNFVTAGRLTDLDFWLDEFIC